MKPLRLAATIVLLTGCASGPERDPAASGGPVTPAGAKANEGRADDGSRDHEGPRGTAKSTVPPPGPPLGDLKPGVPNVIKPGGATTCSRGSEYAFVVVPGDRNKVIVEFEGGGACWDARTCSFADAIFKDKVDPADYEGTPHGLADRSRADNPLRDWTHVYIPYCTGDLHWGDAERTYGEGASAVTIKHRGATNARAALDWLYGQIAAPERIFVTGCSAGGYGSIWWAPHVKAHYGAAKVYQFSDSAAGVITPTFFATSFPAWNAFASYAPALGDPKGATSLGALYLATSRAYPSLGLSQFNTEKDENQFFYYQAMGGGSVDDWSNAMQESVRTIGQGAPNFRSYLGAGDKHCVIPFDRFYDTEVAGQKLTSWIGDMVSDRPVGDVPAPR